MPSEDTSDDEPEWMGTWTEYASAFDRVKSVTLTLSEPQAGSWIAEEAIVSPSTAREHLSRLIELDIVTATEKEALLKSYWFNTFPTETAVR